MSDPPSHLPQAPAKLPTVRAGTSGEVQLALADLAAKLSRVEALVQERATISAQPTTDPRLRSLRSRLRAANNTLRLLGNGCFAVGGFVAVAFLAALFAGQLTALSAAVTVFGALFLGLSGLHFHAVADNYGADR